VKRSAKFLLTLLFAFTALAHADEASKRTKIKELFVLNQMQQRIDQQRENAIKQSREMSRQLTDTMELNQSQEKLVQICYEKMNKLMATTYDWDRLGPAYEEIYAQTYTEEEIDGVLAFYKSPIGRAYMAKVPIVTEKTIAIGNEAYADVMPKIKQLLGELLETLKESGVRYKPA